MRLSSFIDLRFLETRVCLTMHMEIVNAFIIYKQDRTWEFQIKCNYLDAFNKTLFFQNKPNILKAKRALSSDDLRISLIPHLTGPLSSELLIWCRMWDLSFQNFFFFNFSCLPKCVCIFLFPSSDEIVQSLSSMQRQYLKRLCTSDRVWTDPGFWMT